MISRNRAGLDSCVTGTQIRSAPLFVSLLQNIVSVDSGDEVSSAQKGGGAAARGHAQGAGQCGTKSFFLISAGVQAAVREQPSRCESARWETGEPFCDVQRVRVSVMFRREAQARPISSSSPAWRGPCAWPKPSCDSKRKTGAGPARWGREGNPRFRGAPPPLRRALALL